MAEQVITSGSGNWTAPAGVWSVYVECWGGGGNGGYGGGTDTHGGAGGGGGAYAASTIAVIPGVSYPYAVGGVATDTNFNSNAVLADGGLSVNNGVNEGRNPGTGGTVENSIGTIKYKGGDGGGGIVNSVSASGGGAAGPHGAGNNGAWSAAGGSGDAGYGGAGGSYTGGNGGTGGSNVLGGGGGGAAGNNSYGGNAGSPGGGGGGGEYGGGVGQAGQIRLTYTSDVTKFFQMF